MNMGKYLPVLSGLAFSSIFGFTFLFTKEGLEVVSAFQLLGYRFGFAAIFMTLLVITGIIKVDYRGKEMKSVFLLAVVQPVLYFIFEIQGINMTTSSEAGLMISLIPVVVTILAAIFLEEKPTVKQFIFIILSVAGVVFIVLMKGNSAVENNYLGMLVLGGAVLMGGIYNILSRKLSLDFKPVEITFIMVWFGAIVFNFIALLNFEG
ncbi:MAG: DMT family transporter, partial [Halanaerobiales bacterium]